MGFLAGDRPENPIKPFALYGFMPILSINSFFIKLIKLYNKCTFINLCHLSVLFSTNLNKKHNSTYLLFINWLGLFSCRFVCFLT